MGRPAEGDLREHPALAAGTLPRLDKLVVWLGDEQASRLLPAIRAALGPPAATARAGGDSGDVPEPRAIGHDVRAFVGHRPPLEQKSDDVDRLAEHLMAGVR